MTRGSFSTVVGALAVGTALMLAGCSKEPTKAVDLAFVNHIQAGLPEQDVFVEAAGLSAGKVARIEGDAAKDPGNLSKTVYASSAAVPHDPFKMGPNPMGPSDRGASLGFTLEKWLGATVKGNYQVTGDNGETTITADKLVPNATYTVWCSRLTFPPKPAVVDTPCGKADGSQNSFKTDKDGKGTFSVKAKKLLDSTKETTSLIALAYHSDEKTYGATPGAFGMNSHVQVFVMIPPPDDMHWTTK